MNTTDIIVLGTIVAYLVVMVLVGLVFSRKNENVGDFYLGGRKLGPLVTAMSAEASDMSSWLLMGLPGVAYLTGGAEAGWTAIGLAVGTYLNWLIVAKRLRVYSQRCGAITIPDFFSTRYNFLRALYGFWILSLRKAFQLAFRLGLPYRHDSKCCHNHLIHLHGRLPCCKYHRPYPEYSNDCGSHKHRYLWYQFRRRSGQCY